MFDTADVTKVKVFQSSNIMVKINLVSTLSHLSKGGKETFVVSLSYLAFFITFAVLPLEKYGIINWIN